MRRSSLATITLAAAALLVACASPSPTPTSLPTATPTVLPPPPAGTLRVAAIGRAPHRDVHRLVSEWATLFGSGLAYSRLLRFEVGPGVDPLSMHTVCDLCVRWRRVDVRTYEFDLHPDARWPSNSPAAGRPVTAQDVLFSLERLRSDGMPHAALLDSVDTIVAATNSTVRLRLHQPDADLPQKLASPYAVIVAHDALSTDPRDGPVYGSGPWLFTQGLSGQVTLTANAEHHRPGEPQAEAIEIVPAREYAASAVLLLTDQIDIAQVSDIEWPELERAGMRSMVVPRQGVGIVFGVNTRRPALAGAEARQALFHALDPWAALDTLGEPAWVGVGVPVVEPSWLLGEEVLRASFGGAGALSGELTLSVANYGEAYVAHGEALAAQLRSAGMDVETRILARSDYVAQVWGERDFDLFVGPLPPVATTSNFLLALVHSEGAQNVTGIADAELDAIIEAQAVEHDPAARGSLVRDIQVRLLNAAVLFMPAIAAERWVYGERVGQFDASFPAGAGDFWRGLALAAAP